MNIYEAVINFHFENEVYGSERYLIECENESEAEDLAMTLSQDSMYHDDRLDFTRSCTVDESGFETAPEGWKIYHVDDYLPAPAL